MYSNNYSVKNSLKKLFMQHYERYLPTAFDESMSLLEKMNKLIESQNQLINVVNTHSEWTNEKLERAFGIIDSNLDFQLKAFADELKEQKLLYEEIRNKIHSDLLPDAVKQKLDEWMLDGTIYNMVTDTLFPELMERIEEVENRVESRELLDEVSILDYAEMRSEDGNWHDAIQMALEESKVVKFPLGTYDTYPIKSNLSDRSIIGEGRGTKFNFIRDYDRNEHFGGFRIEGSFEPIKRVSRSVVPHTNTVYLENTNDLAIGDKIVIKSQRSIFSYPDCGDDWLLGRPTGQQLVPFGEFADVLEVHDDHIVLSTGLIYPSYNSSNAGEVQPAQDFSTVQKVNFASNWVFKDFEVIDMHSGFAVRGEKNFNMVIDNVHFDDRNYYYGNTGIVAWYESWSCQVRNSSYFNKVNNVPGEYYWTNVIKLVGCQSTGAVNCFTENAGQSVDMTYLTGGLPNTLCYVDGCEFVNNKASSMTTHGGNYMSQIINNKFIGARQGINHRGRGGTISNNLMVGSTVSDISSMFSAGVLLYEGGGCDNIVSNNVIRNYNVGVGQRDNSEDNGRIGYAGNIITGNTIKNCNHPIHIYRLYTGAVRKIQHMGIIISNNQIQMINKPTTEAVMAIDIGRAVLGVTVTGNIIRGIKGDVTVERKNNFHGVTLREDASYNKITHNTFIDIDRGVNHLGKALESEFDGQLYTQRKDNEYIRVRMSDQLWGTAPYPNEIMQSYPESN